MDRLGESVKETVGQIWAGAHSLLWSFVLHTQCYPTATGDHKVKFRKPPQLPWCKHLRNNDSRVLVWVVENLSERLMAYFDCTKACSVCSALTSMSLSHRYQYYLQLKKDVLEGRITCSLDQAIRLASLAVQGENLCAALGFCQKCKIFCSCVFLAPTPFSCNTLKDHFAPLGVFLNSY